MSQKFFAYHLGVQGVLGRKINRFFHNHRAKLTAAGIHAPIARDYRPYLRDFVVPPNAAPVSQSQVLSAFGCPRAYAGITLSNDQGLSAQRMIYENGEFLYWAESRIEKLTSLFADHRIIFLLEVENFATFLPRHLTSLAPEEIERISAWPLADFVWSDFIAGIQEICPAAEIIVVPTEISGTRLQEIIAKMTTGAVLPKPSIPSPISPETIQAFQTAIGAQMGIPMGEDASEHLYDVMGWDHQTRILLSRQYYSEILELYHTCTLIL